MGKFEIALPDDLDAAVEAAVARGEYQSKAEAVCAAVEDWRAQQVFNDLSAEDLRKLWDEGLASGSGQDDDAVFARLKDKHERRPSE